jgi:hypothetical protein
VRLGEALQLNVVELRKGDRPGRLPPALSAWITLLEQWREDERMSTIVEKSARPPST